jgi:subtilisin family serine protease
MLQPWLVGAAVVMSALLVPYAGVAPESEPLNAMIVVLRDNVRFEDFRAAFRADERAQANPEAWNYLDQGVAGAVQTLEARLGFRAHHVYSAALRGFAAQLTAAQISALESDPLVAYLEPDGVMRAFAQTLPWGIDRIDTDLSSTKAGDGTGAVSNVAVIIIDSGIDRSQVDLNVAAHVVVDGLINWDCNSHGTHVSGTAAAIDNDVDVVGAAPGAPLIGVKVLNCLGSGATSTVIKGVDLVTANAPKPAVVNMSLGGQASDALDTAIKNSVNGGFFYAVAAGNEAQDACNVSPARLGAANDGVMTVAATDQNNQEASFSNFGPCVDIWAPGVDILSTKLLGGTKTLSGTSMASPHVAGTAALYLSANPSATPAQIEAAIKANAVSTGTTSKDGRAISLLSARNF